jgi:SAM-dependent methyltransferase
VARLPGTVVRLRTEYLEANAQAAAAYAALGFTAEGFEEERYGGLPVRICWASIDLTTRPVGRLVASAWLSRWDRMSVHYLPRRDALLDAVARVALGQGTPGRRVLDLGAGPGSLARQLAARRALVVAVELDPALRLLGAAACGPSVRFESIDLRDPLLGERLRALGAFDAVVLVEVLHYLSPDEAVPVLAAARGALISGGRIVVADQAECGRAEPGPWRAWWDDLAADGLAAAELDERSLLATSLHSHERAIDAGTVVGHLREAGFHRWRRHRAPAGTVLVTATT